MSEHSNKKPNHQESANETRADYSTAALESNALATSNLKSSFDAHRPTWQLPPGVSRGTWDYCTSPDIATEYDQFHAEHPLLDFDQQWIAKQVQARGIGGIPTAPAERKEPSDKSPQLFSGDQGSFIDCSGTAADKHSIAAEFSSKATAKSPPTMLDLGCGTGRAMVPWNQIGWRTIGFDLSPTMLREAKTKISSSSSSDSAGTLGLIHGNLAQLDCIASNTIDVAICLYSSIGMVRGRANRIDMLRNVSRSLKPGGLFVVHCHNRGMWIREPGGIIRILQSYYRSLTEKDWDHGDRIYPYRGLPSMFLHIFSRREMVQDLRAAGFTSVEALALNNQSSGPLKHPNLLQPWRAGGFLFAATVE